MRPCRQLTTLIGSTIRSYGTAAGVLDADVVVVGGGHAGASFVARALL